MRRSFSYLLMGVLAIVPIIFGYYFNFDTTSAIIFLIVVAYLIGRYRKKLDFQSMVHIGKLPLVYAVLWKTKFGLKFMDKIATKYRETVKLIGYSFIGFAFFGMIFISINILILLWQLFTSPKVASEGVALVLPLTNIPGVGYLSFWHFLITLFVVVLIHEFAHGIVARAHNIPVKSSGLGVFAILLPVFPLAFVEPDEKQMAKKGDVVQYSVLSAGPMINIVFAILILGFSLYAMNPLEGAITHPVGLSFGGVMDDYGAMEAGLEPGMIITSVNGVDVVDYQGFTDALGDDLAPGQQLSLTMDSGENYVVTTKPSPDDDTRGYIGITGIQNERRINEDAAAFGGVFFWFKGLIKWLYFINIAIGLMNLLPLLVTDGGRMLKIALEKIMSTEKKAQKAWSMIGMLFIFTLLAAFAVKYVGLPIFTSLS